MDDTRRRAIAMLRALKENTQFECQTILPFIEEYHSVLDKLEAAGIDVSDFRIPASWIDVDYSYPQLGQVVKRELFHTKLQAVLIYLAR